MGKTVDDQMDVPCGPQGAEAESNRSALEIYPILLLAAIATVAGLAEATRLSQMGLAQLQ